MVQERIAGRVILSAAKDLLERPDRRKMILRFAQDDTAASPLASRLDDIERHF